MPKKELIKTEDVGKEVTIVTRCLAGASTCTYKRNFEGMVTCAGEGEQTDFYGNKCPFVKVIKVWV